MKKVLSDIIMVGIMLLLLSTVAADNVRTPPGSFAKKRVLSVADFIQYLKSDPSAAARYSRHFSISRDKLISYVRKNMTLMSLKKPLSSTVWYLGKKDSVYTKRKLCPKGTLVFVDARGNPIIVWSCGNPLTKKLTLPKAPKPQLKDQVSIVPLVPETSPDVGPTPPETIEELVKGSPEETVESRIVPPLDVTTPPEEVTIVPFPDEMSIPPFAGTSGGGSAAPALGAIIVGGALRGGGGGGSVTPIPEATSGLVVFLGVIAFGSVKMLNHRNTGCRHG